MDQAHDWTDEQIERISRRIEREYSQAKKDMAKKLDQWPEEFEKKRRELERQLKDKEITRRQYARAISRMQLHERWLSAMVEEMAVGTMSTTERAMAIVNDELPGVCAYSMNYSTYQIERQAKANTMWTLVDEDTVRRLFEEDRELLPFVDLDTKKAVKWNSQHFQSAITQGILQGESIPDIAKRVQSVVAMSEGASIRAARTACTGAENAGRTHAYRRANDMGIGVLSEWRATLDSRTRPSHRAMNGQRVFPGEKFPNGCTEPGDPSGPPEEVWNCRCTLLPYVEGTNYGKNDGRWYLDETIDGMSYDEWAAGKDLGMQAKLEHPRGFTDQSAQIWQGDGAIALEHATELLSKADPLTARVWAKYESRLVLVDGKHIDSGAFFREGEGVRINTATDIDDTCGKGPLSTWFHEFGHNIDSVSGGDVFTSRRMKLGKTVEDEIGGLVTSRYEDKLSRYRETIRKLESGDDFYSSAELGIKYLEKYSDKDYLQDMYRDAIKHIGDSAWFDDEGYPSRYFKTKEDQMSTLLRYISDDVEKSKPRVEHAFKDLQDEISAMPIVEKHSLSDMAEGATKGEIRAGWGHGKDYWINYGDKLSSEAFAEFYSAECIYSETPQTLDTLRRYLPRSYERYREVLDEVSR